MTGPGRNLICQVAEWGALRAGPEELATLRRQPGAVRGSKFSPSLLRHSDEQSILGLAAVLQAIARRDGTAEMYRDWGVVAGPKMFGRRFMAWSIDRYRTEGALGITPHSIPHNTLHAASGTISQALGMHGPNLSVSGNSSAWPGAFFVAASMLFDGDLPGLWLVLTGYVGEKLPDDPACAAMECEAVALALTLAPAVPVPDRPTLRIALVDQDAPPGLPPFSLSEFLAAVVREGPSESRWKLPEAGWVELSGSAESK